MLDFSKNTGLFYNVKDFNYETKFYQLPQILFTNKKFRNLSISAKVLYSVLRDRQELSIKMILLMKKDLFIQCIKLMI